MQYATHKKEKGTIWRIIGFTRPSSNNLVPLCPVGFDLAGLDFFRSPFFDLRRCKSEERTSDSPRGNMLAARAHGSGLMANFQGSGI